MNTLDYLVTLTNTPSPTGYTRAIMDYIQSEIAGLGYRAVKTAKGGVMVSLAGADESKHRVVTAHLDTLGAMVRAIKPDGRLKMDLIGGFGYPSIEGENCLIHVAKNGKTYTGTILMHQTSVHVYADAKTAERNQTNMEIRLDEKVTSAEETRALGIDVGDFISFDPRTVITESGFIKSRHLDDKVSAAILLHLLKVYQEEGIILPYTTHFYFSNNEEIGYGANSNLPEQVVEYLAVDMGAMGDDQQTDEYTVSICVKDASGPYHYELRQHLVSLAEEHTIPYKLDIYPYYGSDASAAMHAGADVKHALLGAGIESSHSYERTHIDSIEATEKMVDVYLKSEMVDG
ncbi:M42 family metallopeptidase [Streptococcus acidominimus]|uniref:Cellulase M-like protein n=1 Tax=Streptococcus acidominimus TaxID=1326 RepID=A0A1Q8EC01_STRAI|nr:M42 family metallopeptidase [Streptococcus acidominimus]MBF0847068.1 M42 family metallopeptidase [Streptococcus danieliae]MBF0818951.1 M42 family metallopeptidase [Streptococcus acidominimus]MBF0838066.1 M42 family metallopeptidase [Streptococcus acidominimus]OLF49326.1 peptidase M42 [Streptococcus acidominimus]TFU30566.1 M42 family peptidase [Streptococcus acidominimus]